MDSLALSDKNNFQTFGVLCLIQMRQIFLVLDYIEGLKNAALYKTSQICFSYFLIRKTIKHRVYWIPLSFPMTDAIQRLNNYCIQCSLMKFGTPMHLYDGKGRPYLIWKYPIRTLYHLPPDWGVLGRDRWSWLSMLNGKIFNFFEWIFIQ